MKKAGLRAVWICASILILSIYAYAAGGELEIPHQEYGSFQLDNGLQVYVVEDPSIPLVETSLFYKVGSVDESPGKSGISHFLEHTMFLGTEALGKGGIEALISSVGGAYNAITYFDFTYYFFGVPSSMLELAIAIEADRMGNLKIDPVEIEREREIIRQERRSTIDNNLFSIGLEQVQAAAFSNTSLDHQVIGWLEDIDNISPQDLANYYDNFYVPNNAVLVVSGDTTLKDVQLLTEKYFGQYAAKPVERLSFASQEQTEEISFQLPAYSNVPIVLELYRTPSANDYDIINVAVLLNILINNESSRVKTELQKNQQLIIETGAMPVETRVPSYSLIYFVPASMDHLDLACQAYDAQVEDIITSGITQDELEMVKKAVLKTMIFSQKDKTSLATSMGLYALNYAKPDLLYLMLQHLNELTVEDIQATAAKYFHSGNRVVGSIIPVN